MRESEILNKAVANLPVSQIFKDFSLGMGFKTLQDIISKTPADLMENKSFNYEWFGELIDILEAYGLLHLLQPTQGNSRV